jgi:hypothetical protein
MFLTFTNPSFFPNLNLLSCSPFNRVFSLIAGPDDDDDDDDDSAAPPTATALDVLLLEDAAVGPADAPSASLNFLAAAIAASY